MSVTRLPPIPGIVGNGHTLIGHPFDVSHDDRYLTIRYLDGAGIVRRINLDIDNAHTLLRAGLDAFEQMPPARRVTV